MERKKIYYFVSSENPLNSIRIQINLISKIVFDLFQVETEIIHPGIEDYKNLLQKIIRKGEILFWHYGGFDFNLNPFKNYKNVYFVFHNITPAKYFLRYNPLISFRSILGGVQVALMNKNNKWIAPSLFNSLELSRFGFKKTLYLPNIVSIIKLHNPPLKDSIPSLIFVGRVAPNKGCLDLLDNLEKLLILNNNRINFYFVGNLKKGCRYGLQFKRKMNVLEKYTNLCFYWYKEITDYELVNLYSKSWLYVSMSEHEGFGLPACESIAYGTPAIYTSSGGQESVLGDLGLVQCTNRSEFYKEINRILFDQKELVKLLQCQKIALKDYCEPTVRALVKKTHLQIIN